MTCFLGVEQGVEEFFAVVKAWSRVFTSSLLVSRASVTCLLGVELGAEEFAVVKGVGDVLAGRGAGFFVFFGVKGVDDVLAGVEQGAYGGVYGDGAVDGFFSRIFRGFRAPPGRPGVERQFLEPSMTKSSSLSRAPLHN